MTEAEELQREWEGNQILRADWDKVVHSPSFKFLCRLINAMAQAEAERWQRLDPDGILARKLSKQTGVRWAINAMKNACVPAPPPHKAEEEWGHIQEDYFLTRNKPEPNQQ